MPHSVVAQDTGRVPLRGFETEGFGQGLFLLCLVFGLGIAVLLVVVFSGRRRECRREPGGSATPSGIAPEGQRESERR